MKTKYIRTNNDPFMNKILSKAIMIKSRLRNKFLKCPSFENECNYKKEKRKFSNNIDILVNSNIIIIIIIIIIEIFWQTASPLFSEKHFSERKLIIMENDNIVSKDDEVSETMNTFFSNIAQNLDINGFQTKSFNYDYDQDHISNIIIMYKDHPSITKIEDVINMTECFHFTPVNE